MINLQNTIQDILNQATQDGSETGVQAAVYYKGEPIVDAFAGIADPATGRPVTADTVFPAFSTTKGIMATLIHRLAERGVLDYDAPIAQYWPEFAAHGKGNILLRHVLGHSAGLTLVPLSIGPEDIYNWDTVCAALADATPTFAPGATMEYHAMTYGWLLGETASRATGRTVPQLWNEEIVAPLGLQDELFCGMPPEADPPIAVINDPNKSIPPETPTAQSVPYWLSPLGEWINTPRARQTCQPASNGVMSARAVAKHYAACLPGGTSGVGGVELLPPARLKIATTQGILGDTGELSKYGLGYGMSDGYRDGTVTAFGHAGHGGSAGHGDSETGLAVGFTKNNFNGAETLAKVMAAIKDWLPES